jgi:Zn-dependent protease with chaperone function
MSSFAEASSPPVRYISSHFYLRAIPQLKVCHPCGYPTGNSGESSSGESSGEINMGDTNESSSLQAGLAALKQRDYAQAIAILESVQQSTPSAPTRARAEMGLVQAYVKSNDPQRAIALCQTLCSHANSQVQSWAKQTLEDLEGRVAAESDADFTGFVPFTEAPPQPRQVIAKAAATPSLSAAPNASSTMRSPAAAPKPEIRLPEPEPEPEPEPATWKQAGRAQKWTNLGKVDLTKLWGVEGLTVVGLIISVCALPWIMQNTLKWLLWQTEWPVDLRRYATFRADFNGGLTLLLLSLLAALPWLFNVLLTKTYKLQPLKLSELERYSPEATRLLKRVCGQRRQPVPEFGLLPDAAPLIFTYGYLPNNTHIVVSQGLLKQLSEDEIATLYAIELAHIAQWDFIILSWITLVAQLPHWVYWQVASWGDRQSDRVLQSIAVAGSSLAYGLYRYCRFPGLALSRMRHYYSDRAATELTGNPNALTRALLKLAIGVHQDIQQKGYTSPLLESLDLLLPVGASQALKQFPSPALLEWDRSNAYRQWLAINNSHGALGDRLHLLSIYAKHWRLESELEWGENKPRNNNRRFLLQIAPFLGIAVGLAIALSLWGLGWIADKAGGLGLSWMWGDKSILRGAPLIGFGIGTFWRINAFFPDIKRNLQTTADLSPLISLPNALPIDSQPIRIQGNLLGRRGFKNWLHQDLWLQTETGLIRLHHTSAQGVFGDLMPQPIRPQKLMNEKLANEPVTVTGWFRRGVSLWIDVETIQAKRGTTIRSEHPVWSTTIGVVAAVLGIYMIFKGGNF